MTRWLIPLLLAAVVQDPAPQDFKARWAAALRKAADGHARLGKFCESKKQLAWAKTQFDRALECDPEHAEAKRLLARDGVEWTNAAKQAMAMPGPEFKECAAKAYECYKPAGVAFRDAARAAEDEGLKEDAARAWRRTIEFWPDCELAHKRLGHELWKWDIGTGDGEDLASIPKKGGFYVGDPRWAHAGEVGVRKEFQERMGRAPKPKPFKCPIDHQGDFTLELQGTWYIFASVRDGTTEQQLLDFAALMEAMSTWLHETAGLKELVQERGKKLPQFPLHLTCRTDSKDRGTNEEKTLGVLYFRGGELDSLFEHMMDCFLHGDSLPEKKPVAWLLFHTLVYFSRTLCGHGIHSLWDKSSGADPNNPAIMEHVRYPFWHRMIREHVWLGDDPPIKASIGTPVVTMLWRSRLKGWALIDFLMTDHRQRFNEFLKAVDFKVRDPKDPNGEKALLNALQWTVEELEQRWRRFVLENY